MDVSPRARWQTVVPFALLLVAYSATAATSVGGGDAGEFAALAARGGVAHPPGYPLFVLFLRALAWLPTEAAHRAALATAVLGALSAWLLFRTALSFGASRASAALVTAIYATSPLTWKLATTPEVFVGNACLALAIVWLSGPEPPVAVRGAKRAALLALFGGLGLAHHHSIVLLAPIGLYGVFSAVRESPRRAASLALVPIAFAVGLSPYAYDWLAGSGRLGGDVVLWGDTGTLSGLLHHVLRRDYGTTTLRAEAGAHDVAGQLGFLVETLSSDFLALPILVVISLFTARERVLGARPGAGPRGALLASLVVAGPLFVGLFNIAPRGIGGAIVERFHLLPAALALVFVAPAADASLAKLKPVHGYALFAAVIVGQSVAAWVALREHHRATVQRYAENVFTLVEPRAIVVGSGDHRAGSFMYAEARGVRPDVTFLQPPLMLSEDYRRRMSERIGIELVAARSQSLDANALLRQLVDSGRPIYLTNWPARGMERDFPSYPVGPLLRLVSHPREVPAPPAVLALNERAMAAMTLDPAPPQAGTWEASLYVDYTRPWNALAGAFRAAGDAETAKKCEAQAASLMPR